MLQAARVTGLREYDRILSEGYFLLTLQMCMSNLHPDSNSRP